MGVTVVVGGQYGGEGKGKIISHLSLVDDVDYVVRCGGPNSGHTVDIGGKRRALRLLPVGFVNTRTRLLLAPGALVNVGILFQEMETCNVDPSRIGVDFNTGIITDRETSYEAELRLSERIGSTLSGTGAGVAKRVLRDGSFKLAKDVPELSRFLTHVPEELNTAIDLGKKVVVEGTQGFGLSLYHSDCYPFATSRDTTASGFLSEVGISPLCVDSIIMVIRTYPIRVGGHSGPLKDEITWEELQQRSGYPNKVEELTTTTQRLRRVAIFDMELVKRAAMVNRPTDIAVHGMDYIDYRNKGVSELYQLTASAREFTEAIEHDLGVKVTFIGTGPTNEELIDLKSSNKAVNHERRKEGVTERSIYR